MKQSTALFLIAAWIAGCAPTPDRPLDPYDLVFGKVPASETFLRLQAPCHFVAPNGTGWFLHAGDYKPISADSGGIFYGTPDDSVPQEHRRLGQVTLSGDGIHFPFEGPASSAPALWVVATSLEWGTQRRVRHWALPDRCWKPYGTTMVIIHKGVELPSR